MKRHPLQGLVIFVLACAASASASAQSDQTIIVSDDAELAAAMVPANAHRRIVILSRHGDPEQDFYVVGQPLVVPEGASVEGEGVMNFDDDGRPDGFEPWSVTLLEPSSTFCPLATCAENGSPDMIRLSDGASVRGLTLDGRAAGNALNTVGVFARDSRPVFASVSECEIIAPAGPAFGPWGGDGIWPVGGGAVGRAVHVRTRHPDASLTVRIERSIIDSNGLAGVLPVNLAPGGQLTLFLTENVMLGAGIALNAVGGASGPHGRDATTGQFLYETTGARTVVHSSRNRYSVQGGPLDVAFRIQGGYDGRGFLDPPGELRPGASFNQVILYSLGDLIDGVDVGIEATASLTSRDAAAQSSFNEVELHLIGTTITASVRDIGLCVTTAGNLPPILLPLSGPAGEGNTIRVLARRVTAGSAVNPNTYVLECGPQVPDPNDVDNVIEFIGDPRAFEATNDGLDPLPPDEMFIATP